MTLLGAVRRLVVSRAGAQIVGGLVGAGIVLAAAGCNEDEAWRTFRDAASTDLQSGVSSFSNGLINGAFAVFQLPGSNTNDNSSSSTTGSTSTSNTSSSSSSNTSP